MHKHNKIRKTRKTRKIRKMKGGDINSWWNNVSNWGKNTWSTLKNKTQNLYNRANSSTTQSMNYTPPLTSSSSEIQMQPLTNSTSETLPLTPSVSETQTQLITNSSELEQEHKPEPSYDNANVNSFENTNENYMNAGRKTRRRTHNKKGGYSNYSLATNAAPVLHSDVAKPTYWIDDYEQKQVILIKGGKTKKSKKVRKVKQSRNNLYKASERVQHMAPGSPVSWIGGKRKQNRSRKQKK
jgi:hypothetical protein